MNKIIDKTTIIDMTLDDKIEFSKSVIREWYRHWDGNVFVAFMGARIQLFYCTLLGVFFLTLKVYSLILVLSILRL
jgi:hypothetical protein